ncbi:MAG: hypothetical protein LBB75_00025 [Oscillospiraceae bacterium]|jgi:hypothetical protein|nr:hypothetical protein [Oscillospiraceae bacterium]
MDNDDIKIFAPEAAAKPPHAGYLDNLAAETEALRESGNLDAAKRLGRELATLSAQSPELVAISRSFGFTLTPAREQQLHVLMVFSGQHALRARLPQLLSEAAITAMNNYLINHSKAFWDTISDGSAFTQYLLATPAPGAAQARPVGEAFARMCGQEDNPDLRELGATVFTAAEELVKAKWEEANP